MKNGSVIYFYSILRIRVVHAICNAYIWAREKEDGGIWEKTIARHEKWESHWDKNMKIGRVWMMNKKIENHQLNTTSEQLCRWLRELLEWFGCFLRKRKKKKDVGRTQREPQTERAWECDKSLDFGDIVSQRSTARRELNECARERWIWRRGATSSSCLWSLEDLESPAQHAKKNSVPSLLS